MPEVFNSLLSMRDNDLLICVDAYDNKCMEGHLLTSNSSCLGHFDNIVQLLFLIHSTLDQHGYPEPYTLIKNFTYINKADESITNVFSTVNTTDRSGKLATFYVKIIFRQNASWQGIITWIEDRKEESFRSVLELIFLMDSALVSSK